jgi:hypothetical protein
MFSVRWMKCRADTDCTEIGLRILIRAPGIWRLSAPVAVLFAPSIANASTGWVTTATIASAASARRAVAVLNI